MKKIFRLLIVMMVIAVLAMGCAPKNDDDNKSRLEDIEINNMNAEVREGDFVYRLVSAKREYSANGPIEIYAELEYVGDKESIVIYHAASPFYFPMTETTRDYGIMFAMDQPLLQTTLQRGVPLRGDHMGGGGFSSEDDPDYIAFIKQIADKKYPEGHYVVNGSAEFALDAAQEVENSYKIEAQIDFKVVE